MRVPIPYVHIGLGLAIVLVCAPLVLGKIRMNSAYGIRVPKAFASERNWYALNAYGGGLFLAFGLFLVAFGFLTRNVAPSPASLWAPVFLVVPLPVVVPVIVLVKLYAARLPD